MKKRGSGLGRKVSAPIAMHLITSDISCVALIITIATPGGSALRSAGTAMSPLSSPGAISTSVSSCAARSLRALSAVIASEEVRSTAGVEGSAVYEHFTQPFQLSQAEIKTLPHLQREQRQQRLDRTKN